MEVSVQINGKKCGNIEADPSWTSGRIEAEALSNQGVLKELGMKDVLKVVVVPKKLVNFITT